MVYIEETSSDCNDVLFIDGWVECGIVEDLEGFGVFGAVCVLLLRLHYKCRTSILSTLVHKYFRIQ